MCIRDRTKTEEKNLVVGLYQVKDTMNYRQKPYYITNADPDGYFELNYLSPGKYRILAFEDTNANSVFDAGKENVGFLKDEIAVSYTHLDVYKRQVLKKISNYDGIIIRSRIPVDKNFLEHAKNLKFIARVGAGMENIDVEFAKSLGIKLISSPEGNRDSVAEHVVGMLLILMNRLFIASNEVKNGIWKREENRGDELLGKTFGIIGYGNMGNCLLYTSRCV